MELKKRACFVVCFLAMVFASAGTLAIESGDYVEYVYAQDFNIMEYVLDTNCTLDTAFESDCNITARYEPTGVLVLDDNVMLHDPFVYGLYYIKIPAANTTKWLRGNYNAIIECSDPEDRNGAVTFVFSLQEPSRDLLADLNVTLSATHELLYVDEYEDDLNAYYDPEYSLPIPDGARLEKDTRVYLRGGATTPLPTHYTLSAKVMIWDENSGTATDIQPGGTFTNSGYLFSSFIVPETSNDALYNILLEAWDATTVVGNDVIRGKTVELYKLPYAPGPTYYPPEVSVTAGIGEFEFSLASVDRTSFQIVSRSLFGKESMILFDANVFNADTNELFSHYTGQFFAGEGEASHAVSNASIPRFYRIEVLFSNGGETRVMLFDGNVSVPFWEEALFSQFDGFGYFYPVSIAGFPLLNGYLFAAVIAVFIVIALLAKRKK